MGGEERQTENIRERVAGRPRGTGVEEDEEEERDRERE